MAWTKTDNLSAQASSPIHDGRFIGVARPASKVSQLVRRDVTINFTNPIYSGTFDNGDQWIIDGGDGIEISSKLPAQSTDIHGKVIHGAMKNPTPGGQQGVHQGSFDSSINPTATDNSQWRSELNETVPFSLNPGDVLLCAVSRLTGENTNWNGKVAGKDPYLQSMESFTIMHQAPASTALRPAITDRNQTIYDTTDIDLTKLISLSTAAVTYNTHDTYDGYQVADNVFKYFERGTERLWPVWIYDFNGRDIHPMKHMEDYHAQLADFLSELCCILCTDEAQVGKEQLVKNLCQIAIDYYHTGLQSAYVDSSWWGAPIIIAGYLLGNTAMQDCFVTGTMLKADRGTRDFYYHPDRLDSDDTYTSAYITAGETYSGHKVFFRNNYSDTREYEHLRPDEWPNLPAFPEAWKDDSYRTSSDTRYHVGMLLALTRMGLQSKLNHPASFEMMLRWMEDADPAAEKAILDTYYTTGISPTLAAKSAANGMIDDMWAAHASGGSWPDQGGTTTRTGW